MCMESFRADIVQLRHFEFRITYVTGWRAYLGNAQHNYAHWTKVELPEGRHDLSTLEQIPGVLPFEVYAQAPLRLISWCSFELDHRARALVRELAILCETPTTTITELVEHIGQTPCQYPHRASCHTLPSQAGHSAHCIQGANAKLHYHGPTFPRYPEAAHGYLHVRLLPAHAKPK